MRGTLEKYGHSFLLGGGESSRATLQEEFLRNSSRPIGSYLPRSRFLRGRPFRAQRPRDANCLLYNPFNIARKSYRLLTDCPAITIPRNSRTGTKRGSFRELERAPTRARPIASPNKEMLKSTCSGAAALPGKPPRLSRAI